jgi:hypothetical protein
VETAISKIVGVARFDRESYLWILWNDRAGGDAAIIVMVTEVLIAIGVVRSFNLLLLLTSLLSGLIAWLIYTGITWAAGKYLLDGYGNFAGVFRIAGFAWPARLLILAFIFFLPGPLAFLAGSVWFLAIVAFGLKEAMELPQEKAWIQRLLSGQVPDRAGV